MSSDSEFSDDDILYTDSEVDEFALEEQGSGAAQWEPDAWDAEDSEVSKCNEDLLMTVGRGLSFS